MGIYKVISTWPQPLQRWPYNAASFKINIKIKQNQGGNLIATIFDKIGAV